MPCRPRSASRSSVGCVSNVGLLMVVAGAADVLVQQGRAVRGLRRRQPVGPVFEDGCHRGVGQRADFDRAQADRLDRPDAILAPGLIDTHTHAAMSLFRGIADDLRLQEWLEHYIFPAEARNVTPEFVRWG